MTNRVTIKLTANFERNLADIEQFLAEAEAPQAFDGLIDELLGTVLPNLERFPELGRPFFNRAVGSAEATNATAALKSKLAALVGTSLTSLREYVMSHYLVLYVFASSGDGLDEERIVKSATGIRNTVVWKKLYKFQRDGVVGAIDKLERFGGCIIADSVGLGKTFEALAIIKYHELRNDRVLVLCPKRLRDNWTLYKANDRRNVLAPDRLNYDVLTSGLLL